MTERVGVHVPVAALQQCHACAVHHRITADEVRPVCLGLDYVLLRIKVALPHCVGSPRVLDRVRARVNQAMRRLLLVWPVVWHPLPWSSLLPCLCVDTAGGVGMAGIAWGRLRLHSRKRPASTESRPALKDSCSSG